jgi:hypothetical protein
MTLVLVSAFALVAGVAIPILAYLVYRNGSMLWLPALFVILTVLALLYAWRFGFHPRLQVTDQNVEIINPFRRHSFEWDDITVIAPGENGLLIGSEDSAAEAWCVQKSNFASSRGRVTRADRIADQLLDIVELHDPPTQDQEAGSRIRRARPDESKLLTRLERAASEDALAHIFPPNQHPYPTSTVARRWRQVLSDRLMHTYLLEVRDSPVGYVAGIRCVTSVSSRTTNVADTAPRFSSSLAWRSTRAVSERHSVGYWPTIKWHVRSTAPAAGPRRARGGTRSIPRIRSHFS